MWQMDSKLQMFLEPANQWPTVPEVAAILKSKWNAVEFQNTNINNPFQSILRVNLFARQQDIKYLCVLF